MSGRSAYVRKKITETKKGESGPVRNYHDELREPPTPSYAPYGQDGSHYGLPHGRRGLADSSRETDVISPTGSRESDGSDSRRLDANAARPLDDFAYARVRKPTIKPDDMSGISKSGMRSAYDKRSEDIRKGLSKAFGFGSKRDKAAERGTYDRPGTSMTVRPQHWAGDMAYEQAQNQHQPPPQVYELAADSTRGPPTLPPPTSNLPPLPAGPHIKRWIGTGRPVQHWNKLRKDPELWDLSGDVLVYLGPKGQSPRIDPSFRLSSHIIEATDSRYLITLLREGVVDDSSPLGPGSGNHSAHPTSPLPDDISTALLDGDISYEIFFPPPANASKIEQLRHQLTTRNVFAVLCHVSLVGLSLHQTLCDLHARLDQYMPHGRNDNVLTLMSYISARGIDDVRNDPEAAVGLLAWSEDPKVRWEEAWRESFVHAAGLYGTGRGQAVMDSCADFKGLSPITRALLERASLETQLRVQAAEERLASFDFADMWPAPLVTGSSSGVALSSPAKETADRLQRFFVKHYRNVYGGRWPPAPAAHGNAPSRGTDEAVWLTRTVTQALQKDFGALYDYLVNRDIIWDMSETRASRKWLMVSESGNKAFEADAPDLPITDILIEFDNRQRFPHIPHPYPLVPESVPAQLQSPTSALSPTGPGGSGSMSFLKRNRANTESENASQAGGAHRPGALERRVQLAYTESTNIYLLGSDFSESELIKSFVKFEKTDRLGEVDPSLARRGRWVLIYGILQTLASVSVDAPGVRYREGVPYHLSPQLKGARIPPWSKKTGASKHAVGGRGAQADYIEAAHELSHCWTAPGTWTTSNTSASEDDDGEGLEHSGFLDDGRGPLPNPGSPPLSVDQDRFMHWPPPLRGAPRSIGSLSRAPTSYSMSMSSEGGAGGGGSSEASAPTWLRGDSSQSTTRATTPATTPVSASVVSPTAQDFAGAGFGRHRSTRGKAQPSRARLDGEEEWEPVMRRVEMGYEPSRRDRSSASEAGSSSSASRSARRGRGKKDGSSVQSGGDRLSMANAHLDYHQDRSLSPAAEHVPFEAQRDYLVEESDRDHGVKKTRPRHRGHHGRVKVERPVESDMAPVIWDFDALDVDDIMPN